MRDSGGKEKDYELQSKAIPESASKKSQHKGGMAKVQRDAEGNIILVEEEETSRENTAWGLALNSDDEDVEDDAPREEGEEEDMEEESEKSTDVTKCEYQFYMNY
jgi:hypothetical protein